MSFPRYPKYKPSGVEWLGEVPEHWETAQLRHFVDIENGTDHKHVEQSEGFPVYGSGGVFAYASDFLYNGESVLLGRKGTIDKPLYVNGPFWTVDTMYWTRIRQNASGRYAYYAATTFPFDLYSTNTALPSMTKGVLKGHVMARPPLPEQRAIAEFLDRETGKIDELVAEQRRLMELLKEKRQAVISHAVTKGLNPHAPMKPSGIEWLGDVPEHWDVTRLGFLCFKIGSGKTPSGGGEAYLSEGITFIRSQNVYDDGLRLDDVVYVSEATDAEQSWSRVLPGDILLNITGASLGRTCLVPSVFDRANVNQHVCILRLTSTASRKFISMVLKSSGMKSQFDSAQNGAAREGLNFAQISKLALAIPPQSEQDAVVRHLDTELAKFDTLTAEAQCAIDLLQERRTALISAAVTGQIDVRQQLRN